jgi:hypothetical protein
MKVISIMLHHDLWIKKEELQLILNYQAVPQKQ